MKYKVDVGDLQTGMYVSELDRSWVGTPFLFQGFLIESNEEVDQLKATCSFVIVDEAQSTVEVAPVGKPPSDSAAKPAEKGGSMLKLSDRGTDNVTTIREVAQENISQMFAGARQGAGIGIRESQAIVERLVRQSVNLNLMLQLANLHPKQDRDTAHSMNTAILAIAFGRHLGHSEDRLRLLGLGAILHDIGKTRIPAEIINKPAKLTDAEFAIMKHHPMEGFEMLGALDGVPDEVLDMVRYHHERANGSGYPNGLQGDAVPLSASIIAIVDSYETLTADTVYK
ncbi:MAG: HD-GYP domain-containing protein, partial [Gammaproteobacteria bacterium]